MFSINLKTKLFFLPLEVKARELYPKLYFASKALEKNYSCFIGDKAGIFRATKYFNNGVYFYKSINSIDTDHIVKIKERNNKYIVQDEEGGFTLKFPSRYQEEVLRNRTSKTNVNLIDKFFNWGKFDNRLCIKHYKKEKNKFSITGGLRFDISTKPVVKKLYKDQIKKINDKYGKDYILITTSHLSPKKDLKKTIRNDFYYSKIKNKKKLKDRLIILKELVKLNKKTKELLIYLTKKLPNKKFILRPHPSESAKDWQSFFKKNSKTLNNTSLDLGSEINALIFNSKILINSKSACGLHALMQKKRVISFVPKNKIKDDNKRIVDETGFLAETMENVFLILTKKLNNKLISNKNKNSKIILDHIKNFNNKQNAAENILYEVNKFYNFKSNISLLKILLLSPLYTLSDYFFKLFKKGFYDPKLSQIAIRTNLEKMGSNRLRKFEVINFFKNNNQLDKIKILSFGKSCFFICKK
tara:strand:- start:5980 stop:7392 length:1413 start_codon:yes stop_codon:yes gene_type:complete